MSPTVVAIIMVVVTIGFILWNKIPLNFVMFVVPFVCMLLLGFSLTDADQHRYDHIRLYAAVRSDLFYHAHGDRSV